LIPEWLTTIERLNVEVVMQRMKLPPFSAHCHLLFLAIAISYNVYSATWEGKNNRGKCLLQTAQRR